MPHVLGMGASPWGEGRWGIIPFYLGGEAGGCHPLLLGGRGGGCCPFTYCISSIHTPSHYVPPLSLASAFLTASLLGR